MSDKPKVESLSENGAKLQAQDPERHDMMSDFFKMVMKPFQIFHGTISGLVIVGVAILAFLVYREVRENRIQVQKLAQEQEFINKAMYKQNQQNVLYKIIDTNLKASLDDKLRTSQALWNRAQTKGNKVPLSLICAVFEHESGWNPNAVNGDSNATGLGQQILRWAIPYLRLAGVPETTDSLKDPAIDAVIAYDQLYDHQTDWVRLKKIDWTNWTFALHSYAWGGRTVENMNMKYPTEMMALQKKYQAMGLE